MTGPGARSLILLPAAALCVTACLSLAACSGKVTHHPVPVTRLGLNVDSPTGAIIVQPGDTVWRIAQRYRLNLRDIIDINKLTPPYHLDANQRLLLPAPAEHVVGANDTILRLSMMYAVPVSELVSINHLSAPYTLVEGQRLRLPAALPTAAAGQGDDIATLAQAAAVAPEKTTQPERARPLTRLATGAPPQPEPAASAPRFTGDAGKLSLTPLNGVRGDFSWPVQGQVISKYGPKTGGLYNDGINIAAAKGSTVKAAADGTVVYVGSDLKSYGNMVLLRHPGGFVTAYAHMEKVTVARGAIIRKGQALGAVGNSGTVSQPQLHFEIRKGSQTYDPARFLG